MQIVSTTPAPAIGARFFFSGKLGHAHPRMAAHISVELIVLLKSIGIMKYSETLTFYKMNIILLLIYLNLRRMLSISRVVQ